MPGLLEVAWSILPAAAANAAPVFASRLFPRANWPVDLGVKVRGRRLFGSHKTWRGLVAGVAAATATVMLQQEIVGHFPAVREYDHFAYSTASWLLGAGLGAAALGGDLVKSAIKRQLDIAPGQSWFPFDQIDWLLGTIAFASVLPGFSILFAVKILLVGLALHLFGHFAGYLLRLNPAKI